jgi:hypothetical protein
MVNIRAETGRMPVFSQNTDRLSGFDDAGVMVLAGNDRLAAARGLVFGTLLGLTAWTLLIVALWS